MLEKIINGFGRVLSRRDPLEVDPNLLTLLVETRKEEQAGLIKHLKREDAERIKVELDQYYVVYVHNAATYKIDISDEQAKITLRAKFKKPGVYLMHPHMGGGAILPGGIAVLSMPHINIAPFNSKISYETVLNLFSNRAAGNRALQDHFELARKIKRKGDALPDDRTDYHKEIFEPQEEPRSTWYRPFIAGALAAATLFGVRGYYEEQADKNRDAGWRIEHDMRNLMSENDLARLQEIEKENAEKRKLIEEINRKQNEEARIRTEKWRTEQREKWNAEKEEFRNDLQTILRRTYNVDVKDFYKEAYCSDPVMAIGPNWSETTFTARFSQPEYVLRAYFRTDWKHGEESITRITTAFAIAKEDGKTISFDEKGRTTNHNASEEDKKYVSDFVQKHNIAKVRKDVIDAVIKEKGHHQADSYIGR